jgi:hypothetical protein
MTAVMALALAALAFPASAQGSSQGAQQSSARSRAAELPVTKVVLFSSGVAYYERRGQVSGDSLVSLPFAQDEVNDALKSLIVSDGSGASDKTASPSVSYPSRESLDRALRAFRIDLSGSPSVADLIARLRGAEIAIDTPETVSGRIVSVEQKPTKEPGVARPYVLLVTASGLRSVALDDAQAIRFADPGIGADFDRALALILDSRDEKSRSLEVRLPGSGNRQAAIGYVIAAPVWKVSYRLDLSTAKPQIQGWAIVDNPTGQDWKDVSLSLVSGRPVSFIQDLYAPLYLERPTLPLAIAGIAAARSFDTGFDGGTEEKTELDEEAAPKDKKAQMSFAAPAAAPAMSRSGGAFKSAAPAANAALGPAAALETAQAGEAGDLFQFTVRKPVSLERGRSAMLPLVAGEIQAERASIYSASSGPREGSGPRHPMLGARLVNSSGIRLPAGPIAVFDGGVYAGDALLDFFPEKDSRLIVFGEDLGVTADVSASSAQETVGVAIAKGAMTFSRMITTSRSYAFKNGTADAKKIIVEHPITQGAELFEPRSSDEKTESVYRFSLALPAAGEAKFVVKERSPSQERIVLGTLGSEDFLAYSSSQEIPQGIRDALKKAIDLRRKLEDAKRALADQKARKESLSADQARYRSNLDTVGRDSSQGQQYLKRLMDSETAIDQAAATIADAQKAAQDAQSAYEGYLANLTL